MSKARPGPVRLAIRRLANPAMVGWWSFGITLVAWLVSMYPLVLRGETLVTWRSVGVWLVIVLAGQAALFSVLLLAKRLWLARTWPRQHPSVALWTIVLAVAVGLGVSRTVASVFFRQRDWLLIGGEYFLFGVVAVVIAGSASVVFSEYRDTLVGLGATRASLEAAIGTRQERLILDRERVLREAHSFLDEALERLRNSPATAAAFLTEASDQVVRPLSHRLVQERPEVARPLRPAPLPRWREVFATSAKKSLISPLALAFAVLFLSSRLTVTPADPDMTNGGEFDQQGVSISVDLVSLGQSLLQLLIIFSVTLVVALIVQLLTNRVLPHVGDWAKWAVQVLGVFTVALVSQAIIVALFVLAGFPITLVLTAASAALVTGLVVAVSFLVGVVRALGVARRDVEAQLQELNSELEWALSRLGQQLWHQRRDVGLVLHGSVRSALIASAMQLRRGGGTPGEEDIEEVTQRLGKVRDELGETLPALHPALALTQLVELWRGTCDISVEADEATMARLAVDALGAESAMQVIEEACANAISHGKAHSIRIRAVAGANWIDIDVTNDGESLVASSQPGLGSTLLDEVATRWDLSSTSEGTRLRARLPLQ